MDKFIATANIKKKEFLDNRERENPIIEVTLGILTKKKKIIVTIIFRLRVQIYGIC